VTSLADSASHPLSHGQYVMQPASRTLHALCSFLLCIVTRCLQLQQLTYR